MFRMPPFNLICRPSESYKWVSTRAPSLLRGDTTRSLERQSTLSAPMPNSIMSSILFFSLAAHEFATTDDDAKCGSGGGRHGQQEPCNSWPTKATIHARV